MSLKDWLSLELSHINIIVKGQNHLDELFKLDFAIAVRIVLKEESLDLSLLQSVISPHLKVFQA